MKIEISVLESLYPPEVNEKYFLDLDHGLTVFDISPEESTNGWAVIIGGKSYAYSEWHSLAPIPHDHLIFVKLPEDFISTAFLLEAFTTAIISLGINYVAAQLMGVFDIDDTFEEIEPTYNFRGIENRTEVGIPIPIVYGTHKVGGNYIETNLTGNNPYQSGNNYGNVLDATIAVSEGPVDGFIGVTINGNPISNYLPTGTTADFRLGSLTQTAHDSIGTTSINTINQELLPGGGNEADTSTWSRGPSLSYSTSAKVNQINLNVLHYDGLVLLEDDGDTWAEWTDFIWRYRTSDTGSGAGTWTTWTDTFQTNVDALDFWKRVYSLSFSPFTTTVEVPLPSFDFYDIEVARFNTWGPDQYKRTGITLDNIVEIQYNDLIYPGVASVRLNLQADKSLNANLPRIVSELRGRTIERYNGSSFEADSPDYNNPAWVVYDLLTNTRYGMGNWIDATKIDLVSFKSWGDWCNQLIDDGRGGTEKRCTFNGVFGSSGLSSWNAILRVCATARAVIVLIGDTIKVKYEYDRTPTQLFNMGNIVEGSWKQEFISTADRPTRFEVKYLNASNDYQPDVVGIDDPDATLAGQPQRTKSIDLIGITRESQALRESRFRMNVAKLNQIVEFQADIDAVACEPGDLILVSHDVPQWGFSGRVVEATSTTIKLDRDLTLKTGFTYEVMVRTEDDNRETKIITSAAGNYTPDDSLTIDGTWTTTPSQLDIYSFGIQNIIARPIVVNEIITQSDLSRSIRGVIYDSSIHDDAIGNLDNITYSDLPNPALAPGCVTNLTSVEVSGVASYGQAVTQVRVGWNYPDGVPIGTAQIWVRTTSTTSGTPQSTPISSQYTLMKTVDWPETNVILENLTANTSYEITVLAVSPSGASKAVGSCSSVLITPQGAASIPGTPTNVTVIKSGINLILNWDAVTNIPVAMYEIRRGSTWTGSIYIGQTNSTSINTTNWAPTVNSTIEEKFFVRAISQSGQYGVRGVGAFSAQLPYWNTASSVSQSNQRQVGLSFWPGSKVNMVNQSPENNLVLISAGSNGTYEIDSPIDMGSESQYRIGAILHWKQTTNKTFSNSTYDWNSSEGNTNNWSGVINPDLWTNNATIYYAISHNANDYSDWIPLNETQIVDGANISSTWTNSYRYLKLKVEFDVTSSNHSPILEQFYITTAPAS